MLLQAFANVAASCPQLLQPQPATPLLLLRDVTYSTLGGALCVSQLDLTIWPGAAILVEGPSGCGKSTLMRILGGLHAVDSGTISLPPPDLVRPSICPRYYVRSAPCS